MRIERWCAGLIGLSVLACAQSGFLEERPRGSYTARAANRTAAPLGGDACYQGPYKETVDEMLPRARQAVDKLCVPGICANASRKLACLSALEIVAVDRPAATNIPGAGIKAELDFLRALDAPLVRTWRAYDKLNPDRLNRVLDLLDVSQAQHLEASRQDLARLRGLIRAVPDPARRELLIDAYVALELLHELALDPSENDLSTHRALVTSQREKIRAALSRLQFLGPSTPTKPVVPEPKPTTPSEPELPEPKPPGDF